VAQKHLNLPYVGMLKKLGSIGMAKDVGGDMLIKNTGANTSNKLLDAMHRHKLSAGVTREGIRKGGQVRGKGELAVEVSLKDAAGKGGDRDKAAYAGFSRPSIDMDLLLFRVSEVKILYHELNKLPCPKAAIHKNNHDGLLFIRECVKKSLELAKICI